jgi:hypothetical protein
MRPQEQLAAHRSCGYGLVQIAEDHVELRITERAADRLLPRSSVNSTLNGSELGEYLGGWPGSPSLRRLAQVEPVARFVLPSGCRDSPVTGGTGRNQKERNGNSFPSGYREFLAKAASRLSFLGSSLPDSILVSSTAFV